MDSNIEYVKIITTMVQTEAIKIGYQGMEGSNSERAAKEMAQKRGFTAVEYVNSTTSAPATS